MSKLITKDLTIANDDSVLAIFSAENGIDPLIQQATEQAKLLMKGQDVTTQAGRDKIRADAFKFAKLKTATDKLGESSISEHNKIIKSVNSNRKSMRDEFDVLRDKVRAPLTKWEEEDAAFKKMAEETISAIKQNGLNYTPDGTLLTLDQLQENMKWLEMIEAKDYRYLADEVTELLDISIKSTTLNIRAEEKRIADAEELKRLQEAEAKRQQEEAAKAEAERLAEEKRLAEQKAKEAQAKREQEIKDNAIREQQAEAERQQREAEAALKEAKRNQVEEANRLEAEKQQAVEAERAKAKALADKLAKEEAEKEAKDRAAKAEEERLLANKRHIGNVRREAKESLMLIDGVHEELAKKIVLAISKEKVSRVSISYT